MALIKVSSQSNPNSVAGAVATIIREHGFAEMQVIGAGALNQGMKAVAIARGFLAGDGIDLVCAPVFTEVTIDGELRTALRLALSDRHAQIPPEDATMRQLAEGRERHASRSSSEMSSRGDQQAPTDSAPAASHTEPGADA